MTLYNLLTMLSEDCYVQIIKKDYGIIFTTKQILASSVLQNPNNMILNREISYSYLKIVDSLPTLMIRI